MDRFEYLARFYSQAIMEEWHCKKCKGGGGSEARAAQVSNAVVDHKISNSSRAC